METHTGIVFKDFKFFFDSDNIACITISELKKHPKYNFFKTQGEEFTNKIWDIDGIDVMALSDVTNLIVNVTEQGFIHYDRDTLMDKNDFLYDIKTGNKVGLYNY